MKCLRTTLSRYRCSAISRGKRCLSVGVASTSGNAGGFSGQLFGLLSDQRGGVNQSDGLACSKETLSTARTALVSAAGLGREGMAPEAVADNLRLHYQSLQSLVEKEAFFSVLASHLCADHERVAEKARQLTDLHSQQRTEAAVLKSEGALRLSLSPFYSELFTVIAKLEGGIKFLVDMRGDLLAITKHLQESGSSAYLLMEMSNHLKEILSQWFAPQLLDVCQITWQSPCDLLEKVSSYEAVHPLRHWKDLKHRLGANRRCFAFMHRAIPNEPIVILHVALTAEPSSCIHTLLDRTQHQDLENVTTANFYSISSTQKGLSGVELGNFLIRRVVRELQREFLHRVTTFVTLSPIPGFKKWLDTHLKLSSEQDNLSIPVQGLGPLLPLFPESSSPTQALVRALEDPSQWARKDQRQLTQLLEEPLTKLCARYLAVVKRRGYAVDPVAHFHLQNGASIWRLNWMADVSPKGMGRSYGLMVNYHYHLPDISTNSDHYRINKHIDLSHVEHWLA